MEGDLSSLQPAVILAGTHIDLLHHDIKVARKIAKEKKMFINLKMNFLTSVIPNTWVKVLRLL